MERIIKSYKKGGWKGPPKVTYSHILLKAGATSILAQALSRWDLNIFKDKNSASLWNKLSQCLTSPWEECLYPVGIFLFCHHRVFCLLCLCCSCMTSVWLHQLYRTSLSCCRIMWAPCSSFLFLKLEKSCSVSFPSQFYASDSWAPWYPLAGAALIQWHLPCTWESKTGCIIPGNLTRVK